MVLNDSSSDGDRFIEEHYEMDHNPNTSRTLQGSRKRKYIHAKT